MIKVAGSFGAFGKTDVASWDRSRSSEGHVDDLDELSEEDVMWGEGSKATPDHCGANGTYRSLLTEEIAKSAARGSQRGGCANIRYVEARRGRAGAHAATKDEEEEEEEAAEEEEEQEDVHMHMHMPPHEIVAREYGPNSPSVLQGTGRTLKGMDLRRVRNAVWLQTGFQD